MNFCYQSIDGGETKCFKINESFIDGSNTFKWNQAPETTGDYKYYLDITSNGNKKQTETRLLNLR